MFSFFYVKLFIVYIIDLEDAVINYSAELNGVSCIITSNIDDYKNSTVLAVRPYSAGTII